MEALLSNVTSIAQLIPFVVFLYYLHRQAMTKLDTMIEKVSHLDIAMGKHQVELANGAKEFERIEEHQKIQDEKIHELAEKLHTYKNNAVTLDTLNFLLDNKSNNRKP